MWPSGQGFPLEAARSEVRILLSLGGAEPSGVLIRYLSRVGEPSWVTAGAMGADD